MPDSRLAHPNLLLMEGASDQAVFEVLLQRAERSDFGVVDYGGKTRLAARLRAIALDDDFRANRRWMGVVRDADDD